MSEEGANIEKLLERYVTGDLTESDRQLVEQYLTGSGADAARAREDLKFERLIVETLALDANDENIADAVLERVFKRPLPESRKSFRADLALTTLRDAESGGRIGEYRARFWTWRVRRYGLVAASVAVFVGAMWVNSLVNRQQQSPLNLPAPMVIDSVAEVAYLDDTRTTTEQDIPSIPVVPAGHRAEAVEPGAEIKTDAGEAALVRMKSGGVVYVQPMSRVQIRRSDKGRKVALMVLEGALSFDFTRANGAVTVESSEGHHGRLKGVGHLTLASRSTGTPRPSMEASFGQIMLVRVKNNGYAVFRTATGDVRIKSGQVGVVSPETVLAIEESRKRRANVLNPKDWALDEIVTEPNKPAVQVAQRLLRRRDVIQEALRVFEFELIDLLAGGFAIDMELTHLRGEPTMGELADANRYVHANELIQVLPLRSADAQLIRARQLAGMMAIDRIQRRNRQKKVEYASPHQIRQRVWGDLNKRLKVDRKVDDPSLAFRVHYRGNIRNVGKREAWNRLRQYMRRSELENLVKGLAQKTILDIWLENRKLDWPDPPDAENFSAVALAQMAGLTRVQMLDQLQIETLILQNSPPPSSAQIEAFMKEKVWKRRRLLFDHYFFPTTDPFRGAPYDAARCQQALERATALSKKLQNGQPLTEKDVEAKAPQFAQTLFRYGPAGGPKPWWNQIYGRQFTLRVMSLSAGESSDVIPSPEGYHVVRLRQEGEDKTDPRSHKSFAQMLYRFELARQDFEEQVRSKTNFLCPLEDILK